MPVEQVSQLPMPGEVEFIMGGPPCQGYSGMNRCVGGCMYVCMLGPYALLRMCACVLEGVLGLTMGGPPC